MRLSEERAFTRSEKCHRRESFSADIYGFHAGICVPDDEGNVLWMGYSLICF